MNGSAACYCRREGGYPVPTIASVVAPLQISIAGAPNTFQVEWLDDTGAGRLLGSIKHYAKHLGVPEDIIREAARAPSQSVSFYTVGGNH